MNLSKDFTLQQLTRSHTAIRNGIDNTPNEEQVQNLVRLAENVLQPLRHYMRQQVNVTSGFRSAELNSLIGGATKMMNGKKVGVSQHCHGEAADLDVPGRNAEMFRYIRANLEFDQLIWEYGGDPTKKGTEPDWIHVSYREGKNRSQVLRCVKKNGKPVYIPL
jgi:hypothetical protein